MVIDAEFEEIPKGDILTEEIVVNEQELNLTADESLPWLESDEDEATAGGIDSIQVMTFLAVLLALAAAIILAVWYFTKGDGGSAPVADGSTIAAPTGPIKERPENPGGKEFEGTGGVAPAVGEGEVRDSQIADGSGSSGSQSGSQDTPRPSIETQKTETAATGSNSGSNASSSASSGGFAVQLAAYGNRARAEQGWRDLSRSSETLSGKSYRIVEANVDIGKVFRLQVPASSRNEAASLCDALKADGLECAVKP